MVVRGYRRGIEGGRVQLSYLQFADDAVLFPTWGKEQFSDVTANIELICYLFSLKLNLNFCGTD